MGWDAAIEADGFAILPELLSHQYLDHFLEDLSRLAPCRSRAGVRHALKFAPVEAMARNPRLVDLVRGVVGPAAFPFRATLFDKSPAANWLVVWHQDTALPLCQRLQVPGWGPWSVKDGIEYAHAPAVALAQVLALRIHLDDSEVDNGPLRVLPTTHTLGVLSDDSIHHLATRIVPVDCIAPKGGVVAMRPLIVHASSKSKRATPRRVLHIEYAASASIASPMRLAVA